jgi:hypothetical protein
MRHFVPKADIRCTSGRIYSIICVHYKTGTLSANQQAHLFVAKKEQTL